jgi:hypothetical protein
MRQKRVSPKWVDKLLLLSVISIARFLLKYSDSDMCKHAAGFFLGYFSDLVSDIFPSKGRSSNDSSGKRHSP